MPCRRLTTAAVLAALVATPMAGLQAQSLKVLHHFSGSDGTGPTGLVQASDGQFYGATTTGGT